MSVALWFEGRASEGADGRLLLEAAAQPSCVDKMRRTYTWIVERAVTSPCEDMELGPSFELGRDGQRMPLCQGETWSSFALLPLLTLVTSRRLAFVGATGRGKSSLARVMALLAGQSRADGGGRVSSRVKIVEDFDHLPAAARSQMTDGGVWYLTVSDETAGAGLDDAIDVVVRCPPFHSRYLSILEQRVERGVDGVIEVPSDIVFKGKELEQAERAIRDIRVPLEVRDALGFFLGQLNFCGRASERLEYKNKDTLRLTGRPVSQLCNEGCPLDKSQSVCAQTENGVSARAYQGLLHLARALAWFRGNDHVTVDDVRVLLPWVLQHRLTPNAANPAFQDERLLHDRVSWIQQLFDRSMSLHAAARAVRGSLAQLRDEVDARLRRGDADAVRESVVEVRIRMDELLNGADLDATLYEDLVALKSLHARCTSALRGGLS